MLNPTRKRPRTMTTKEPPLYFAAACGDRRDLAVRVHVVDP